jgi:hypothetical protein
MPSMHHRLSTRYNLRSRLIVAGALTAAILFVGAARADSSTSSKGAAASGDPAEFWTPQRMRNAKPIHPSPGRGWAPGPATRNPHTPSIGAPGSPPTVATPAETSHMSSPDANPLKGSKGPGE